MIYGNIVNYLFFASVVAQKNLPWFESRVKTIHLTQISNVMSTILY